MVIIQSSSVILLIFGFFYNIVDIYLHVTSSENPYLIELMLMLLKNIGEQTPNQRN